MSAPWHWLIIIITIVSIVGCLWLLFANARGTPGEDTTGHVWDETLREYNNPLPRWWLNLFVLTIVFAAGYLIFYPGLGNFAGSSGWTQEKQLAERLDEVKAKRQAVYAALGERDVAALARDPAVLSLGREVFLNNCAGCHGATAQGALGFPNLADKDWLYGGTPEAITTSIRDGRRGMMPPFNGVIDGPTADALVATVQHWSDSGFDPAKREIGLKQFNLTCAACHGTEAKGNPLLGSANLGDSIWLHGGGSEQIRHSILFGRQSNMPAHKEILTPDDIRVVAGYVYSLSQ